MYNWILVTVGTYQNMDQAANTDLYNAGTSRTHCADHMNIWSGGGAMPL